ncbi:hypothetical protein I203_104461 [Kwoniella mangroviensis CBS 8507]|uniref:uncharacterized protein n=1 Tax=Kwoniella mangroviensis CBS 8507 TaxID=1296122 RepID=UPI00305FD2E1
MAASYKSGSVDTLDGYPSLQTDKAGPSTPRTSRACSSCSQQKLKLSGAKPLRGRMRGKRKVPDPTNITELSLGILSKGDSYGMLPPEKPTMDYVRWKRNTTISGTVPTNSTIWKKHTPAGPHKLRNLIGKRLRSEMEDHPEMEPLVAEKRINAPDPQAPADVVDRLTSLPLPGDRNPLAVLAEASAAVSAGKGDIEPRIVSSAVSSGERDGYYAPLHRTLKDEAPHIMTFISATEAEKLFELYFSYLHPHLPLLDATHSSPSIVARRNNFLFNAICCASAKARDPFLWTRLSEFAHYEMERLPKEKNIDVVQGHLIYTMWNLHRPKHFELDMTWLRVGMAVRTAMDINLHRVALSSQAREGLPVWVLRAIVSTWLSVYIVDRTMSAQFGKSSTMYDEHSIQAYITLLRPSPQAESSSSSREDLWIAALAEWTQTFAQIVEKHRSEVIENTSDSSNNGSSSTTQSAQGAILASATNHKAVQQFHEWRQQAEVSIRSCDQTNYGFMNSNKRSSKTRPASLFLPFTMANIRLYQQYADLVVHSFSLERLAGSSRGDLTVTVIELQSAAIQLIQTYHASFDAIAHTRHGCPDTLHNFVIYAAVSLLRILRPRFLPSSSDSINSHGVFVHQLLAAKRATFSSENDTSEAQAHTFGPLPMKEHQNNTEDTFSASVYRTTKLGHSGNKVDDVQNHSIWPPLPDNALNPLVAYLETLFPSFDDVSDFMFSSQRGSNEQDWVLPS